jgi:hypothetical protein
MIPGHKEDCSKLEALLDDYLHGKLPRATADRLVAHLGSCGDCREALDDLRISAKLVGAAFEQMENPGRGFTRLVMAHIKATEQWLQGQGTFWRPFEALAVRMAFSAALALAVLFAYGVRMNSEAATTSVTSVSLQQPDIFAVPVSAVPSNGDDVLMTTTEKPRE